MRFFSYYQFPSTSQKLLKSDHSLKSYIQIRINNLQTQQSARGMETY